jgi:hypothetical protein
MSVKLSFTALLIVSPALMQAENWTGALVDAKCYDLLESNHSPKDTEMAVDRDRDAEIRYCRPGAKTRVFELVNHDGINFHLDAAGNTKAVDLVRANPKQKRYEVKIAATQNRSTLAVETLSLEPR